MQVITQPNGNVTFLLEDDDGEMVSRFQDQVCRNRDHEVLASVLDYFGFAGNARFMPILPEDIGALTDAPMFTDALEHPEDGSRQVTGDVWWYPGYEVDDFSHILLTEGQVTFTKAKH